jgi:hypothetical protein
VNYHFVLSPVLCGLQNPVAEQVEAGPTAHGGHWLSNRAPSVKFFLAKQISARAAASSWRELAAAER